MCDVRHISLGDVDHMVSRHNVLMVRSPIDVEKDPLAIPPPRSSITISMPQLIAVEKVHDVTTSTEVFRRAARGTSWLS